MWLLILPFAALAAFIGYRATHANKPKLLGATPQMALTADQMLAIATTIKTQSNPSGIGDSRNTEIFRYLGPINASRVATQAIAFGGHIQSIVASLAEAGGN